MFIIRIASSLVALGISTLAYSNSWAENLKVGVVGPYSRLLGYSQVRHSAQSAICHQPCTMAIAQIDTSDRCRFRKRHIRKLIVLGLGMDSLVFHDSRLQYAFRLNS